MKGPDVRLISLLFCLGLGVAVPVAAQQAPSEKVEIMRLLQRMDEFVPIEAEFRSLGFEGRNLELAMAQHRRVFGDPEIASYVADRLLSAYSGSLPSASVAGGLLGPLIDRGIGHLPTRELVYFYKVETAVFQALPTRECGLAVKQRLSDQRLSDATARVAARLNTPALEEYYRIQYKAARLGLTRERVVLGAARETKIEEKIGKVIFEGPGSGDARELIRVFENPERASNRRACEAGRTIMAAVMAMRGDDLREALLYFSAP